MFTVSVSFFFLGVAVCILAASVCLSKGKRAGYCIEVDLDALRAVSVCLPTERWAATDDAKRKMYKELLWDKKSKMDQYESDVDAVVSSVSREGNLAAESDVFVGSHDGVVCATLPGGRRSPS